MNFKPQIPGVDQVLDLATQAEVDAGTVTTKAVTPATLKTAKTVQPATYKSSVVSQSAYPLKKTWLDLNTMAGVGPTTTPTTFMAVGDSLAEQFFAYRGFAALQNRFGIRGVLCGSGLADGFGANNSGGSSYIANDFTRWWTGKYDQIPVGGSVVYDYNGTNPIWGNAVEIFFLKEPGAGTFKVQTSINGAAYTDVSGYTAVSTDGSVSSGYVGFSAMAAGTQANLRVKIIGVSGTCRILGARIWNADGIGIITGCIAVPGKDYADWRQCPQEVLNPVFAQLAPAAWFHCNIGVTTTANLDEMFGRLKTAYASSDIVVMGVWPTAGNYHVSENLVLRRWADDNNAAYWTPETIFPTWQDIVNAGMSNDETHPKPAAYSLAGHVMAQMLFMDGYVYSSIYPAPKGGVIVGSPMTPSIRWPNNAYSDASFMAGMPITSCGSRARLSVADQSTSLTGPYDGASIYRISGTLSIAPDQYGALNIKNTTGTYNVWISGGNPFLGQSANPWQNVYLGKTVISTGTTGAQTINQLTGRVNFAAGQTSLVVTCDKCMVNSIIQCTIATNDATAAGVKAVAAAGSFTIYLGTAPTAETAVNFSLTN